MDNNQLFSLNKEKNSFQDSSSPRTTTLSLNLSKLWHLGIESHPELCSTRTSNWKLTKTLKKSDNSLGTWNHRGKARSGRRSNLFTLSLVLDYSETPSIYNCGAKGARGPRFLGGAQRAGTRPSRESSGVQLIGPGARPSQAAMACDLRKARRKIFSWKVVAWKLVDVFIEWKHCYWRGFLCKHNFFRCVGTRYVIIHSN